MNKTMSPALLNHKDANILVVDDDFSSARLIELSLNDAEYKHISLLHEPTRVTEYFNDNTYDLLILDLNMPELDGFGVMEQLKQHHPDAIPPILVLTGEHEQQIRVQALESGARDFLTKPFHRQELLARVANLIEVHMHAMRVKEDNDILENLIQIRTNELEQTRLEIIRRLGHAAEYRDNETGMHIIRMSKTSELIAREIGLNDHQCCLLLHASPMHDIGKIGIPDSILLKPGKLTSDEWEIMKTHTTIGTDILSGSKTELLTAASIIAGTHHEQWDGSGYPNGLSGEEIPLFGRIVSIADVFDALTSERPYKKAWSVDAAMEYIQNQSGKQFEPELVKAFMSVIPQAMKISQEYPDSREEDDIGVFARVL